MLRLLLAALAAAGWLAGQDGTLLVLQKGASSLGFFTAAGRLVTAVPVGRHPHEMALSADGRYAYITDNGTMRIEHAGAGGNTVSIVDLAARKKVGEISLGEFRRPHGIDLHRQTGLLAVTTESPDQLIVIDAGRRQILRTYPTGGKTSHMVSWGPGARWAYVSNSNSATVAAIERATGKLVTIAVGTRPEGSVLAADGKRLFVVNRESASITVIDTEEQRVAGQIPTGTGPVRIARTPDGQQLVYALMHENKIEFADPARLQVLGQASLPDGPPVSLTVSPDGAWAFASAEEKDTVFVVSIRDRKLVRQFKTAPGAGPDPVFQR
jgi:YVTN family beta-propeller protein